MNPAPPVTMTLIAAMLKGYPLPSPVVTEQNEPGGKGAAASEDRPDVDSLVAQLRARVETRRRAGLYPPGLEDEMSAHFSRILDLRRERRSLPDLEGPI